MADLTDEQIEDLAIAVFTASQGPSPMADKLGRIDGIIRAALAAQHPSQSAGDFVPPHCDPDREDVFAEPTSQSAGEPVFTRSAIIEWLDGIEIDVTDWEFDQLRPASPPLTDAARASGEAPIDMVLHCPACGMQHVDAPESDEDYGKHLTHGGFDNQWTNPPHRSHLCHGCGHIWRPADVPTNGVAAVKTKGKADSPIATPAEPDAARVEADRRDAEIERLRAIINTPQADDFLRAVSIEAEHQRQRWPSDHDAGKTPADWYWLVGHLAGKALHAQAADNTEKAEHHIITTAAACANWHRAMFGRTNMRPGIDGDAALAAERKEQA